MSWRPCDSPSAGRAGTGPSRALVAAGRSIAVITGSAFGLEAIRWAFGAGAAAGLGYVTDSPAGRHTTPAALRPLAGQKGLVPVHISTTSQTPAGGRRTAPAVLKPLARPVGFTPSQV